MHVNRFLVNAQPCPTVEEAAVPKSACRAASAAALVAGPNARTAWPESTLILHSCHFRSGDRLEPSVPRLPGIINSGAFCIFKSLAKSKEKLSSAFFHKKNKPCLHVTMYVTIPGPLPASIHSCIHSLSLATTSAPVSSRCTSASAAAANDMCGGGARSVSSLEGSGNASPGVELAILGFEHCFSNPLLIIACR